MYGIYANIGGILMGSMLPYIWQHHGSYGNMKTLERHPEVLKNIDIFHVLWGQDGHLTPIDITAPGTSA